MKIAIVGSRGAGDDTIDLIIKNIPAECSEIISGGAVGIDTIANEAARRLGIKCKNFLPDYDKYGKIAPLQRNITIIENADYVMAFWDYKSHGTRNVISECIKRNIPFRIFGL